MLQANPLAEIPLRSRNWGRRFSAKARGPSRASSLANTAMFVFGGRVAEFKLPKTIDHVAELPRDSNGKLYKRRLRDPYRKIRDRAI